MKIFSTLFILLSITVFCRADSLDDEFELIISDFEVKNKAFARMIWGGAKDNNNREEELQQIREMGTEYFEESLDMLLKLAKKQSDPNLYKGRPKVIPEDIWEQVVRLVHSRLDVYGFEEDETKSIFVDFESDLKKCEYYSEIKSLIPKEIIEISKNKSWLDSPEPECFAFVKIKTKQTLADISKYYAMIWMKANDENRIRLTSYSLLGDDGVEVDWPS